MARPNERPRCASEAPKTPAVCTSSNDSVRVARRRKARNEAPGEETARRRCFYSRSEAAPRSPATAPRPAVVATPDAAAAPDAVAANATGEAGTEAGSAASAGTVAVMPAIAAVPSPPTNLASGATTCATACAAAVTPGGGAATW